MADAKELSMSDSSVISNGAPNSGGPDSRFALAKAGNTAALAALLEAWRGYLLAVANDELGSDLRAKVGASDLVQETLIAANDKFALFRGTSEAELLAWLKVILLNKMTNVTRAFRETEKRRVDMEEILSPGELNQLLESANPLDRMIVREKWERLDAAVARLPPVYRQVIQLRSMQQLSFVEIGERIGRTEEAARKLWSRAVDFLSKLLRPSHES
jgi:RNA polymerase sigma-70 factor (ECF subfamily)